MYQLSRAYAREDRRSGRWHEVDIADLPLRELPQRYPDICFIITYPALQGDERAVFYANVANLTKTVLSTTTVQEWLTSLGNQSLPVEDKVPTFTPRYVRFINGWYGRFLMDPIGPSRRLEPEVSKFDKQDILIRHPAMDGPTLRKQAMVSVNGYFHFTEYTQDGILVHDGNKTILKSNMNQIGIYSFKEVGEINYVNITDDMIVNKGEDEPLSNGTYITLPGDTKDYEGKTVLFVFNGYLQALGKGYNRVGLRTFKVQLSNMLLLERLYQSRTFLDLEDVPLTHYPNDPTLLSTREFYSDEMIRWWLNRSQTFFVVVDTPSMFQELEPVEHLSIPGRFIDEHFDNLPLMGTYGRMLEYRALRYPGDRTVLATDANRRHRFDFQRMLWDEQPGVTAGRYSEVPFQHDHAYWRLLGTQD